MPDLFDSPEPPPLDLRTSTRQPRPAPAAPTEPAPASNPTPPATPAKPENAPGQGVAPEKESKATPPKPTGVAQVQFADATPRVQFRYPSHSNVERPHPKAITHSKQKDKTVTHLNTFGLLGELDDAGLDLLAGHIARTNGVSFSLLPAYVAKNPGGFGITLNSVPPNTPAAYLYPAPGQSFFAEWMRPLIDYYQRGGMIDRHVPNFRFPTWQDGAAALMHYLHSIRGSAVPLFPEGPGTAIVTLLATYNAPCLVKSSEVFPLSTIIAEIIAIEAENSSGQHQTGDNHVVSPT